jgi:antirestriction protein
MLNIYINTWGNYNKNGADLGEWVTLPMDESDLDAKLEEIAGRMGDNDPEYCIHDYEWTTEIEGRKINENEDIAELNEYVQALDDLSEWEQKTYCAAVEYWGGEYIDLDDLDEYVLHEDIENEYDLGYYWAVESGCYDLSKMGNLASYFDFEAFGRDINLETDGGFTSFGWIERC